MYSTPLKSNPLIQAHTTSWIQQDGRQKRKRSVQRGILDQSGDQQPPHKKRNWERKKMERRETLMASSSSEHQSLNELDAKLEQVITCQQKQDNEIKKMGPILQDAIKSLRKLLRISDNTHKRVLVAEGRHDKTEDAVRAFQEQLERHFATVQEDVQEPRTSVTAFSKEAKDDHFVSKQMLDSYKTDMSFHVDTKLDAFQQLMLAELDRIFTEKANDLTTQCDIKKCHAQVQELQGVLKGSESKVGDLQNRIQRDKKERELMSQEVRSLVERIDNLNENHYQKDMQINLTLGALNTRLSNVEHLISGFAECKPAADAASHLQSGAMSLNGDAANDAATIETSGSGLLQRVNDLSAQLDDLKPTKEMVDDHDDRMHAVSQQFLRERTERATSIRALDARLVIGLEKLGVAASSYCTDVMNEVNNLKASNERNVGNHENRLRVLQNGMKTLQGRLQDEINCDRERIDRLERNAAQHRHYIRLLEEDKVKQWEMVNNLSKHLLSNPQASTPPRSYDTMQQNGAPQQRPTNYDPERQDHQRLSMQPHRMDHASSADGRGGVYNAATSQFAMPHAPQSMRQQQPEPIHGHPAGLPHSNIPNAMSQFRSPHLEQLSIQPSPISGTPSQHTSNIMPGSHHTDQIRRKVPQQTSFPQHAAVAASPALQVQFQRVPQHQAVQRNHSSFPTAGPHPSLASRSSLPPPTSSQYPSTHVPQHENVGSLFR